MSVLPAFEIEPSGGLRSLQLYRHQTAYEVEKNNEKAEQ
jgi:hypothetical protein